MVAMDTTPEADEAQLAAYRRLTLEQRMALVLQMSDDAFELTRDGIRMRHPEYDERQVFLAFARLLHGDEVFLRVWRGAPLLPP
ncbi:MAG: hypothetical protein F9K40_09685 [Kofleriaceae bacterium]|nr:MAG: hypothetical protein F9K40_09685 [Kofleriaceae bacterium]MBZ0237522.1 hypothetical protein [Kofleriaceae bacterium]